MPKFSFLYTSDQANYPYFQNYKNSFIVINGQLTLNALPDQKNGVKVQYNGDMPTLYVYDVTSDSSHQVTFDEAKKLNLDPGPSSPDGYTVKFEYNSDGIFGVFGSNGNGAGYFFEKGGDKKRINGLGDTGNTYYSGTMNLIGWIQK